MQSSIHSMKFVFIGMMTFGVMNMYSQKDTALFKYLEISPDPVKHIEIATDNDVFGKFIGIKSDNDFTTGIRIKVITDRLRFAIPFFIGFNRPQSIPKFGEQPLDINYNNLDESYFRDFQHFEANLIYYTPDNLRADTIITQDRPYASYQYLAMGRISDIRKPIRLGGNTFARMETQLQLGLVGGPAAESLQRWYHRNLNKEAPDPQGWKNQIGLNRNIPVFNYLLKYDLLMLNKWVTKRNIPLKRKNYSTKNYSNYNIFQWMNTLLGFQLNAGSVFNDFEAGIQFNLFNLNHQNDYYLVPYDGRSALFPSGGVNPNSLKIQEDSLNLEEYYLKLIYKPDDYPVNDKVKAVIKKVIGDVDDDLPIKKKVAAFKQKIIEELIKANYKQTKTESKKDISTWSKEAQTPVEKKIDSSFKLNVETIAILNDIINQMSIIVSKNAFATYYLDPNPKFYNQSFSFRMYTQFRGRFVAHNGLLQGPLFYNRKDNEHTLRYIKPLVGTIVTGIDMRYKAFNADVSYTFRTSEYEGHEVDEGVLKNVVDPRKIHVWGTIKIGVSPCYLAENNKIRSYRNKLVSLDKSIQELLKDQ
ncbi:MAG: lipid A deacylase LpxR family protein [Bacteroidota bacterium]|nr:lipid A deacylase LpxR family protein [Bacteroidota bacterium]